MLAPLVTQQHYSAPLLRNEQEDKPQKLNIRRMQIASSGCSVESTLRSCAEELPPDRHPDYMPAQMLTHAPLLRVACFRHGESAANAGDATHDPMSIPLTEKGEQQALAISRCFADPPNIVIGSPFDRARQTAAPTLSRFPSTPIETWPIQEFTYLAPTKCAGTSAAQRRPWVETYWDTSDPTLVDGPGAESFAAFIERVRVVLNRLMKLLCSSDLTVVMFGHGQFFQAMRWLIETGAPIINADAMRAFRLIDQRSPIHNGDGFVATFDGQLWALEQGSLMR
ncbi:histidine phosphatase family protein [Burkholderia diffusa]|uniref:histidine phosphatase family protein n=1 Tax=Burkholderia diffusa TaxID=488732 RepID=UPI0018C5C684|nr:histidine phosphatase family protein [Burkholderia diffusa]